MHLKKIAEIDKKIRELEKLYKDGRMALLEKANELSSEEKDTNKGIMADIFMCLIASYLKHTRLFLTVIDPYINPVLLIDKAKADAYLDKYASIKELRDQMLEEPLTSQVRARQVPLLKEAQEVYQIEKELLETQQKEAKKVRKKLFSICAACLTIVTVVAVGLSLT